MKTRRLLLSVLTHELQSRLLTSLIPIPSESLFQRDAPLEPDVSRGGADSREYSPGAPSSRGSSRPNRKRAGIETKPGRVRSGPAR